MFLLARLFVNPLVAVVMLFELSVEKQDIPAGSTGVRVAGWCHVLRKPSHLLVALEPGGMVEGSQASNHTYGAIQKLLTLCGPIAACHYE